MEHTRKEEGTLIVRRPDLSELDAAGCPKEFRHAVRKLILDQPPRGYMLAHIMKTQVIVRAERFKTHPGGSVLVEEMKHLKDLLTETPPDNSGYVAHVVKRLCRRAGRTPLVPSDLRA